MKTNRRAEHRTEAALRQRLEAANRRIAELEAAEDRRESAAALADTREQIELIVDTLPVLLAYVGVEQRYLYVNRLYAEWYGLAREKIIGKHVRDVLPEATYQKAQPVIEAALRGQRITYENDAAYDAHGQPHTVRATYVPHLDENGQAKAFLATVEDITERKQAEREIQDLARFPGEDPNPVLRVSGEGMILYANQASLPLLDAWGCRESQLLPAERREIISQSFASASCNQVEIQCKGHTLLLAIAPVVESGYANIYGFDITRRKQVEERVKHLNAVLRAIRDVNQLIVREKDRERLLQGVCSILIKTRGYYNAWIALLDESGALSMATEAGLGEGFLPLVERLECGELTYCMQKALTRAHVLTVKDPLLTCAGCPLANGYSGRGGMAVRLEHAEEVYGLLVVSTSGGIIADKEEQELFVEVARDIALALHDMEAKEAREQAEMQLVEQLDELRRWHAVTLGREARVLGLKHEVNELLARAGQQPRYPSAEEEDE